MTVSELIQRGVSRAGGSQNAFAREMAVTPNAVTEWRDGRAIPGFDKVPRLAEATGLTGDVIQKVLIQARIERDLRREDTLRRLLTELPRKRPGKGPRTIRGGGAAAAPRPDGGERPRVGPDHAKTPKRSRKRRPGSLLSDMTRRRLPDAA